MSERCAFDFTVRVDKLEWTHAGLASKSSLQVLTVECAMGCACVPLGGMIATLLESSGLGQMQDWQ